MLYIAESENIRSLLSSGIPWSWACSTRDIPLECSPATLSLAPFLPLSSSRSLLLCLDLAAQNYAVKLFDEEETRQCYSSHLVLEFGLGRVDVDVNLSLWLDFGWRLINSARTVTFNEQTADVRYVVTPEWPMNINRYSSDFHPNIIIRI